MELNKLTLIQLKTLSRRVAIEISKRSHERKRDFMRKAEALAKAEGFTLSEVLAVGSAPVKTNGKRAVGAKPSEKLPIRFWNPLNPSEGWSGHGRRPAWAVNWLANGGKMEELAKKRT